MHRGTLDITTDEGNEAERTVRRQLARFQRLPCRRQYDRCWRRRERGAASPRLLDGELVWPSGEQCEALEMTSNPASGRLRGKGARPVETPHSLFVAARCTAARGWNQSRCPSADRRPKKTCYTHAAECSVMSKNEILSFAAAWMKLEDVTLREKLGMERQTLHVLISVWELEKMLSGVVAASWGEWRREGWLTGARCRWVGGVTQQSNCGLQLSNECLRRADEGTWNVPNTKKW